MIMFPGKKGGQCQMQLMASKNWQLNLLVVLAKAVLLEWWDKLFLSFNRNMEGETCQWKYKQLLIFRFVLKGRRVVGWWGKWIKTYFFKHGRSNWMFTGWLKASRKEVKNNLRRDENWGSVFFGLCEVMESFVEMELIAHCLGLGQFFSCDWRISRLPRWR